MHPPTTKHSIGGVYSAVSEYVFGNMDDAGKLMGLGPYGRKGVFTGEIFDLRDGRVFVNYDWQQRFVDPSVSYDDFKARFQYFADIAYWVQREVERAVLYVVDSRYDIDSHDNLCYAGGVALNAVANNKILKQTKVKNIYMEPAAGDNGLAIGCAYYGWMEVLKRERVKHDGSTTFGIKYSSSEVADALETFEPLSDTYTQETAEEFLTLLAEYGQNEGYDQFDKVCLLRVEGIGDFELMANDTNYALVKGKVKNPTCALVISAENFVKWIFAQKYIDALAKFGQVELWNADEVNAILTVVDAVANIKQRAKNIRRYLPAEPQSPVIYQKSKDYIRKTAELLAAGKVIGWFQEGSEFGPRALGHRSILADPRNPEIRNFINREIKFREDFRPFAPSVLREDVNVYFEQERESPYMILVDQIKPEWKPKIPSVVHQDDSCRIQTVTPDWNPRYYELLQEFKKLTGVSVLVNTSFNKRGMPIVETPYETIQFFLECAIDYIVVEDYIIGKRENEVLSPNEVLQFAHSN